MPNNINLQNEKNFSKPDAIVFDFGETLLMRTFFDVERGLRAVVKALGHKDVTDALLQTHEEVLVDFIMRRRDESTLEVSYKSALRFVLEYNGIDTSRADMGELEIIYTDAAFAYDMAEGLMTLLDRIEALNIKKAVVSNSWFSGNIISTS